MVNSFGAPGSEQTLTMPGLEPDNLLALLALLGLLRCLEASRPDWNPRALWKGPPWIAQLSLSVIASEAGVAEAANDGIRMLLAHFDVDHRSNVNFEKREDFRRYAQRVRTDPVSAALASALTSEWPEKRNGGLPASPLVLMFGQGHQNFLERLTDIPRGELPARLRKLKSRPNLADPAKIAQALFSDWKRDDDVDGFRWDPAEDQRYALRYGDPSKVGAAPTVAGANRLAAVGFLSFSTQPRLRYHRTVGTVYEESERYFVWPIWLQPISRECIEAMLNHPALLKGDLDAVRHLGVVDILRARRVANGKFMNVARARSVDTQTQR